MKSINVYWSGDVEYKGEKDWNLLYENPESLYKNLGKNINKENETRSFFECSAFSSLAKNTFVLKNPLRSSYEIVGNTIIPKFPYSMGADVPREPSIKNNILIRYWTPYLFFSEEEVTMTLTPPYLHNVGHKKYGSVIPGRYDISSWIRPVHMEINLWEGINTFEIEENEPLAYITFSSDKKINFIKFSNSEKLNRIIKTCSASSEWENRVPLSKRYMRFHNSLTRNFVLKEIKKNII